MGDRTNPIKFGPEWLRNLSREPSYPGGHSGMGRDGAASGAMGAPPGNNPPPHRSAPVNSNATKVLLAKLRYGREEMLALYDRQTAEAPAQLKTIDTLYQPRGKSPVALNNTFDEDARDSIRPPPQMGSLSTGERYTGIGRGRLQVNLTDTRGRGLNLSDNRGRARGYNRQTSIGRGTVSWHTNQRNSYSGMADDDPNQPLRPWSSSAATASGLRPTNVEQPDWPKQQQQYRTKRQTSTNWRQQHSREDGEEWRAPEASGGGRRPQEKWEWDWPENRGRPNQEKPWHSNRRTWVGGENPEDVLPEWAVDNADACAGTFDATGAFHGYSNDDSNLPKNQESSYPLTRSHTHGSFARSKTAEEGSEEWWASEKAKKLSPKRFDASEIKFKKTSGSDNANVKPSNATGGRPASANANTGAIPKTRVQSNVASDIKPSKDFKSAKKSNSTEKDDDSSEKKTEKASTPKPEEKPTNKQDDVTNEKVFMKPRDKAYEQRPENKENPTDEKGNFQSVILTSNNILRQKHQNIAVTPTETPKRQPNKANLLQFLENSTKNRQLGSDDETKDKEHIKLVEDILQMNLDDTIPSVAMNQLLTNHSAMNSHAQLPNPSMQMRMPAPHLGLNSQNKQNVPVSQSMPEVQNRMMQPIGITNSMLNASLGLPMPNSNSALPLPGMPPPLNNSGLSNPGMLSSGFQGLGASNMPQSGLQPSGMQNSGMSMGQGSGLQGLQMSGLQGNNMQTGNPLQGNLQAGSLPNSGMPSGSSAMPGYQSGSNMPGMNNNSLFNNLQNNNEMPNHSGQNMFPLHGIQPSSMQSFNSSIYSNMMSQPPPPLPNMGMQHNMSPDQWYYEDPNKTIQGPFSSKEMLNWYRAGFFSPTLMVRRACEAVMRPLGTYGHMPFGQMDLLPPFPMGAGFDLRPQQAQDNIINQQPGLGIDVSASNGFPLRLPLNRPANMPFFPRDPNHHQMKMSVNHHAPLPPMRDFIPVPAPLPVPPFQLVQNNKVESLWGQNSNNQDLMWRMHAMSNTRNENRVNQLPMYFWDSQSKMPPNPLLPEDMKTEDEILAQLRGTQTQITSSPLSFLAEPPLTPPPLSIDDSFDPKPELNTDSQKTTKTEEPNEANDVEQKKVDKVAKIEQSNVSDSLTSVKLKSEPKAAKEPLKVDNKTTKSKETAKPKNKSKGKEDKKEEVSEVKAKEEEIKHEHRSAEPSPSSKNKKEDKANKKDLEKEKKEWIKEGFTIVKSADKNKDGKKKAEEAKAVEEIDRKRKEEEKFAAEERKRQIETIRKQQEIQNQEMKAARQAAESIIKKAPWSASNPSGQAISHDGPTLAEIQRLEREKKLEQMKEQQQMMHIIAQQQAAALAREQEMQAGLGWAKKKPTPAATNASLAEIQAEARKQAAAAAAAASAAASSASAVREEVQATPPPVNHVPWGNTHNGGAGFWDTPVPEPIKPPPTKAVEVVKQAEPKAKKKVTVLTSAKKENVPSADFNNWCSEMLGSWRDISIDIPTFVAFLRDIESPYEVKDYVKCYLGDSREASDFARQFLERRSRLLRVGMVTPSDDLCSPAVAVNPRTNSGSDYTEVKGKGKKTKKNKMLKVDARILGFSVTASEDRINVGDIDTV